MKQRKSLDLNSKISLEALVSEDKTELNIRVGKKEYRISDNEIEELYAWLGSEILRKTTQSGIILPSRAPEVLPKGPVAAGPLILVPGQAQPQASGDLDRRRAVVTGGGVQDLSGAEALLRHNLGGAVKDELAATNLSMQIGKAKEAFSKEHINDGGQA